jgi:NADH:ubiquinone oxidoreductase subunit 6 (subunit J)
VNIIVLIILNNIEFLSLIFIIIYIGAIVILSLFVLFILNISYLNTQILKKNSIQINFNTVTIIVYITFGLKLMETLFLNYKLFIINNIILFKLFMDDFYPSTTIIYYTLDINVFSYFLYSDYIVLLVIGSLILLIAIIGSILLVTEGDEEKSKYNSK